MADLQQMVVDLRQEVEPYFQTPSVRDSADFVLLEAAELKDATMKAGCADMVYLRARPGKGWAGVEDEIGDVLLMVLTLAAQLGMDAERALAKTCDKIRRRVADKMAREEGGA